MKIEKISENQIRCMLTKEDLADRQIKLSELAYGSEKAKNLFRDMIDQANLQFGFEADDIPLMIEAIPLTGENIVLQITKVEYPEELDTRFSKFSAGSDEKGVFESEDFSIFSDQQGADDVLDLFKKMKEDLEKQVEEKEKHPEQVGTGQEKEDLSVNEKKKEIPVNFTKMYEFQTLEQMERLAVILGGYYHGENDLYKDERRNRYYLLVRKGSHTPEEFNKVCNIISEYASGKKYTTAAEAFFKEHGKEIIKGNALQMMETVGKQVL